MVPEGKQDRQDDILRGVYEENLRMRERHASPRRRRVRDVWTAPERQSSWRMSGLVLILVVVAVAPFAYQQLSAEEPKAEARPPLVSVDVLPPLPEPTYEDIVDPTGARAFLANSDLPLKRLFGLQVKTIVIDAGHGGRDAGAVGVHGTAEKDIALDVARRLRTRLERYPGYRILMTREFDVERSLRERVAYANEHQTDLFISIHVNALPDPGVTSVETYYFGVKTDAATLRLAERENQDSEYSVAEFRTMIDGLGDAVKLQESERLAASIQKRLYRNISKINRDVSDWGVRTAPFIVLLGVEAPAILAEIACISNPADETLLGTPVYREKLAAFLEQGIVGYLKQRPKRLATTGGTEPHGKTEG